MEYITTKKTFAIEGLNASTKYYVRALASTKVGRGIYSQNKKKFTNGSKISIHALSVNLLPRRT